MSLATTRERLMVVWRVENRIKIIIPDPVKELVIFGLIITPAAATGLLYVLSAGEVPIAALAFGPLASTYLSLGKYSGPKNPRHLH